MRMNESFRRECENYWQGVCGILGCKCKDIEIDDCPVVIETYDPLLAGECEDD